MSLARTRVGPHTNNTDLMEARLRVLEGVARRLASSPLLEVLSGIPKIAAEITGAPVATFAHASGGGQPLAYPVFEAALAESSRILVSSPAEPGAMTRSSVNLHLSNGLRLTTALCIPLIDRTRTYGSLCVYGSQETSFGQLEEHLLSILASHLAQAMSHQAVVDESARRKSALKALHQLGEAASNYVDTQQLLQTIADTALNVLEADFVVLYEYLKSERDFRIPPIRAGYLRHPQTLIQRGAVIPHRDSAIFRILRERKPVYASDAAKDWQALGFTQAKEDRKGDSFLIREGVISSAGIPLVLNEEALGVLFINYRRAEAFGPEQREHIELFASQAGQTISLARHSESLSRLTEVGTTLSSAVILTINQILTLVHRQIKQLFEAKNFYVLFHDEEKNRHTVAFSVGAEEPLAGLSPEQFQKTLAAYVMRTRTPQLINEPLYNDLVQRGEAKILGLPAKIWLGAPMIARGRVLGMIAMQDYESTDVYDQTDLNLLATLANQAAIAIDNAHLLQSRDVQHFLYSVLEQAVEVLDSDAGIVFLRNRNSLPGTSRIRVEVNYRCPELQGQSLRLGEGLAGQVAQTGKAAFNNDYQQWPDRAPRFKKIENQGKIGSLIGAPVIVHGEVVGVMVLTSTPERQRVYTEDDFKLIEPFAEPATLVIDDALRLSFQRALIDNSPYPVLGVDTWGKTTIFNAAAERLTGRRRGEMVGRNSAHEIYANGVLDILKIHRRLEQEGGKTQLETTLRDAGGKPIHVLVTAAFLTDEHGFLLGSITMLEDLRLSSFRGKGKELLKAIDRIDRLRDAKGLIDAIVEEAIQLFADADAACLFLRVGTFFRARSCHYRSGEALSRQRLRSMTLARKSPVVNELIRSNKSFTLHGSEGLFPPLLPQGRGATLLIRIADETETYGLLALESSHKNLFQFEETFVQMFASRCAGALRRRELARSRRRIEDALIRSGGTIAAAQIGAMMIHEIKNSLSNIFWTLDDLKQQPDLSSKLTGKLSAIEVEVERLTNLTNRLREFSNNRLEPKKNREFLNEIVQQTLEVLDSSIRRKRLSLSTDLDPALDRTEDAGNMVLVDSGQISQVIINLTLNALKASREGGEIAFTTRLRDGMAELAVADTGRGMSTTQARSLFNIELSSQPKGGSGLGLLISKLIVENNHSGQISVRSAPGKGTTVSVRLPIVS
jgi:PAS domain S-box-containing protein